MSNPDTHIINMDNDMDNDMSMNSDISNKSNKMKKMRTTILPKNISEYHLLEIYEYSVAQLKEIAKTFLIKMSGGKAELTKRIYKYMYLSTSVIKIQRCFRHKMLKTYLSFVRFKETVNDVDFLTMEKLKELPKCQYFSFQANDGFAYGFDILSFYQLVFVNKLKTNPYTRTDIQETVIRNFSKIIRISSFLHIPLNLTIVRDEITYHQQIELKVISVFQVINSLGNYSNADWFFGLNKHKLLKLIRELTEIWNFRSQITEATKREICHPSGNPFRYFNSYRANEAPELDNVREEVINVLERIVVCGINRESCVLGSYYALCALTLVSSDAAVALPWLYQSVQYF